MILCVEMRNGRRVIKGGTVIDVVIIPCCDFPQNRSIILYCLQMTTTSDNFLNHIHINPCYLVILPTLRLASSYFLVVTSDPFLLFSCNHILPSFSLKKVHLAICLQGYCQFWVQYWFECNLNGSTLVTRHKLT